MAGFFLPQRAQRKTKGTDEVTWGAGVFTTEGTEGDKGHRRGDFGGQGYFTTEGTEGDKGHIEGGLGGSVIAWGAGSLLLQTYEWHSHIDRDVDNGAAMPLCYYVFSNTMPLRLAFFNT